MTPDRVREGAAPVITFADDLSARGLRPALIDGHRVVTYAELAELVADDASRLGPVRRLVLLEISPDIPSIVTYLAALQGRHPVLLVPPASDDRFGGLVRSTYDPDVVIVGGESRGRRRGTVHELHPDLALLLSTSGSTGSPKLVRLSHRNVQANATAIVTALGIDEHDRAITSLPLAYCYGLSILHSHLTSGASVVLTDRSVVDPVFWDEFRRHGVTSLAGVPYTFELLDRSGFEHRDVPTLRRVTQAGGRLDPVVVDRYARLGRRRRWDLHIMYGQTEATARMACLPPALAVDHPEAIGRPVAGGEFHLEDIEGDVGELVYRGPNVMLGYAEVSADLAKGREVEELRTGDLARVNDAGLYEVVGRRHRFVKPFGLRVDLDAVERRLGDEGVEAMCTGDDRRLVITITSSSVGRERDLVQRFTTVPRAAVSVRRVHLLPRLLNGKPDYFALEEAGTDDDVTLAPSAGVDGVRRIFARVLAASPSDIASDASFIELGGDSLSYVEASVRLEELLGVLPHDWTSQSIAELAARRPEPGRTAPAATMFRKVESTVVLRASAVVLIVATHAGLTDLRGGAHLLLAIAGWNFAPFQVPAEPRRLMRSIGRVAGPSLAWILALVVWSEGYGIDNLALLHSQLGPELWDPRWRYWFVEALVQILVVVGALLCVPAVRRLERRRPLRFVSVLLFISAAAALAGSGDRVIHRPQTIVWIFFLGWAAHRADSSRARLAVSAAAVVGTLLFFVDGEREAIVIGGLLVLLWVRTIPLPRPLPGAFAVVASASLWIYLVHWQVYPFVVHHATPAAAVVASLIAGVALSRGAELRLLARWPRKAHRHVPAAFG